MINKILWYADNETPIIYAYVHGKLHNLQDQCNKKYYIN